MRARRCLVLGGALLLALGFACSGKESDQAPDSGGSAGLRLSRLFPTDSNPGQVFEGCLFASPVLAPNAEGGLVVVASSDGTVAALEPTRGSPVWSLRVPTPAGHRPYLIATPARVEDRLVLAYAVIEEATWRRTSHRVAVLDLRTGLLDASYKELILTARKPSADGTGWIDFYPPTALARSTLAHAVAGDGTNRVYISFGSPADIQPFHGWLFEVDLDKWREAGPDHAISGVFLATHDSDCGEEGTSGAQDTRCGGGIWSPAGPLVFHGREGYELLVSTGNGHLDPMRGSYSHSLLRLRPGLTFDPECDAQACAGFDENNPDLGCLQSCRDLFVARPRPGDPPLRPASGLCDGLSFWECLAINDWDLGAGSAARVELAGGRSAYALPGKDGGLYLMDADHLGTMYDRVQVVPPCGTKDSPCANFWAGTMVTQPVVLTGQAGPLVIVPAFMPDSVQAAGLVAFRVSIEEEHPRLHRLWQAPDPREPDAVKHFRAHPGRAVAGPDSTVEQAIVWVVDVHPWSGDRKGVLFGVRAHDGRVLYKQAMAGPGHRYVRPLVHGTDIFVASCISDEGPGWMEAYRIAVP